MLALWVINPGKVIHDILASRRRLTASKFQERAVIQQALRTAALQYYDLALVQARVASVQQALAESQELLRLAQSRLKAGTGLPADELRAKTELSGRQQDLILALKSFYDASVALSLTLHMETTVTLVPSAEKLPMTTLVKSDLPGTTCWRWSIATT